MVVGDIPQRTELLVVGGGPGGYTAALRAANAGVSTLLVEREYVGGTCLNVGCIPSKALLHAADLAYSLQEGASWGITGEAKIDYDQVSGRLASVVSKLTGGVEQLLAAAGVETVRATVTFTGPHEAVAVTDDGARTRIEFRQAIVATGSRPIPLASLPFDGERVVDSTQLLARRSLTDHLVVVGGGYIGLELGTAAAKFGSQVTVIEREDEILPGVHPSLGHAVAQGLERLGVEVHRSTEVLRGTDRGLVVRTSDGEQTFKGDVILVAIGRKPNTTELGLETCGVSLGAGGLIDVGPDRRASPSVLAIGDVTAGPALAHKAMAEAEVAVDTVLGRPGAFAPAAIPMVVYTDPEIASVGLTVDEALADGREARAERFPFKALGRAVAIGKEDGFCEVVYEEGSGDILGYHLAGSQVGELALAGALSLEFSATIEDVWLTIAPHPSVSEVMTETAAAAAGFPRHVGKPTRRST